MKTLIGAIKKSICPILLVAVIVSFSLTTAFSFKDQNEKNETVILSLWQVDSFEGGTGSRTNYLKKIANTFEKAHKNVFIQVTTKTKEGAKNAIESGDIPDMASFGVGSGYLLKHLMPLSISSEINATAGQSCYALSWAYGSYALFSLEDDFSAVSEKNTVVSSGRENLPLLVALLSGLSCDMAQMQSVSAYTSFLSGSFRYLLGTQRDIYRFKARGVNVCVKPLTKYNDLIQYIGVLESSDERRRLCESFISLLLDSSEELSSIGLFGKYGMEKYDGNMKKLYEAHLAESERLTLSPFADDEAVGKICSILTDKSVERDEKIKKLKNMLSKY